MHDWAPVFVAIIVGMFSAPVWNFISHRSRWGESEIARLRRENGQHEREIAALKDRLAVLEHHYASHFARWILDAGKRFCWVNDKAMLTIFAPLGFGREAVLGKLFHDLVDKAAADEIERLDHAALANPGGAVSNLIRLHPDLPWMFVVKVAGTGREGELVYEGIAFRTNDPDIAIGAGIARTVAARIGAFDRLSGEASE